MPKSKQPRKIPNATSSFTPKRTPLKKTYIHSPPIPIGPYDIFFKSNCGKNGWAFLSNYWPYVPSLPSAAAFASTTSAVQISLKPRIRQAEDALGAKKINNANKRTCLSRLSAAEERQLIKKGLTAKFEQNEDLRKGLLATGTRTLHESSGRGASTNLWTLTQDGIQGGNLLGQLLMEVRAELNQPLGVP